MHALKSLFHLLIFVSGLSIVGRLAGLTWDCFFYDENWTTTLNFAAYTVMAGLGAAVLCENLLVHISSSTAVKKAQTRAEIRQEIMQEIHREATKKAFEQALVDRQADHRRAQMKGTLPTVEEIMQAAKEDKPK